VQTEIINKVLCVEDRAQKIIRDSERNARDIVADAQATANEMVRSSLKTERERQNTVIAQAQADADAELAEYEASLAGGKELAPDVLDKVANLIVDKVSLTDFDEGGEQ
jgi:V/A-type H+-transporting ATPase subunit G/H